MIKRIAVIGIVFLTTIVIFSSCENSTPQQIKIAISKEKSDKSTTKYADWLLRHSSEIVFYNLYPMGIDSALGVLSTCNGLLLTGGGDVFPGIYGKIDDTSRCGYIDRYRDSLEFALIDKAISVNMPVFGVCRGEQILNVSQGGTLYIDIPTDFDTVVTHRNSGYKKAYHPIGLVANTMIYNICNSTKRDEVLSNHHQAVEKPGTGLMVSAYSADNLPEAIEWADTTGHAFLMAVQWHPEAMDTLHPLSAPLAKKFLLEVAKYSTGTNYND